MRRVYQAPNFNQGWGPSILGALALTALVFAVLPFTTAVSTARNRQLMLTKAEIAAPIPQQQQAEPPPPEEEPEEKQEPEPQLAETPQQLPLSADLDVAVGSGGALAGFGDLKSIMAETATAADAFGGEDLDQRPQPVSQSPPAYPSELRKARIEGFATVDFVVEEDGRVAEARIDKSSHPEFEKSALDAIRKWRFRPGVREGQPVRSYNRQTFRFRPPS